MEFTKKQMSITKGVAILFMLLLHLFCTKEYVGLFTPIVMIGDVPLIYYFALFGTSQFLYVMGVVFAHRKLYSKISAIFNKIKFKNVLAICLILLMVVAHGFVQSLFVAVFTGIAFIVLFNLIDKPRWLDNILLYVSTHSTNMWLIHMFFYMIYFKDLVFAPKYPVIIFIWLVVLCIIPSIFINAIYNKLIKFMYIRLNIMKSLY
ncbi:MAG: hypothetical protein ACRCXT_05925 [Paraclostridium sp.]